MNLVLFVSVAEKVVENVSIRPPRHHPPPSSEAGPWGNLVVLARPHKEVTLLLESRMVN
jgi:hypothetical protein